MGRICQAFAVAAALAAPSGLSASGQEASVLRGIGGTPGERPQALAWSGRYPFEGPNRENFYELPWVEQRAIGLIGRKAYLETVRRWNSAVPVVAEGNALLVQGCNPDDCRQNAALFVDGNQLLICVFDGNRLVWHVARTTKPLIRAAHGPNDQGCYFPTVADARANLAAVRP